MSGDSSRAYQGEAGLGWTDQRIAGALEVHPATVARVRQHYATAGLDARIKLKHLFPVLQR